MNREKVLRDGRDLGDVLHRHPLGLSTRDLRAEVKLAGHAWGTERLEAGKAALRSGEAGSHRLVNEGSGGRPRWTLQPIDEGDSDD